MTMMTNKKPNSVQVELSRGCNRRCRFCGIHSVPDKIEFMTPHMASCIAIELKGFDPIRLEFALRGEPLLNPWFISIVRVFRRALPKSQLSVTTNGDKLSLSLAKEFFLAGGNIILADCYDGGSFEERMAAFRNLKPLDYYKMNFKPYHRHHPRETKHLIFIDDLAKRHGESMTRPLINLAGNVKWELVHELGLTPLSQPLEKMCVRPFRELSIFYNGLVPLCCLDWREETILFRIHSDCDLSGFWQRSEMLNRIRTLLFNKDRGFGICSRCDIPSGIRPGLVPLMAILNEEERNQERRKIRFRE